MAKHWKDFIKQDETVSKETDEAQVLSNLIPSETSKEVQMLDEIANSNINLKALLEEQKSLEEDMHALTGKTETNKESNRSYDNEIKSINEKRKVEKKEALKKKKRIKQRKTKAKQTDSWLRKKNTSATKKSSVNKQPDITPKRTKKIKSNAPKTLVKSGNTLSKKVASVSKKAKKKTELINNTLTKANTFLKTVAPINVTTEKKTPTPKLKVNQKNKLKKVSNTLKTVTTVIKKASKTTNTVLKTTNTVVNTYKRFSNTLKKLESISDSKDSSLKDFSKLKPLTKDKKKNNSSSKNKKSTLPKSINPTLNTVSSTAKSASKISKVIDKTYSTVKKKHSIISNQLNTIKNQTNNFNTHKIIPDLKTKPKELQNNIELNKSTNLFNTTNQYLNKTDRITKHFESVYNRIDSINKKAEKDKTAFALHSVNNIFTNKEKQTKGFIIDNDTVTTIKKVVDELPLKKDRKSKNNKSFI